MRQKFVTGAEHVFRHAISAAKIAFVGDRNAQIMQPSLAWIAHGRRRANRAQTARRQRLRRGSSPCIDQRNDFARQVGQLTHGERAGLMTAYSAKVVDWMRR